jgi:hypothetical protein
MNVCILFMNVFYSVYELVDVITADTISMGKDDFGDVSIHGRII